MGKREESGFIQSCFSLHGKSQWCETLYDVRSNLVSSYFYFLIQHVLEDSYLESK